MREAGRGDFLGFWFFWGALSDSPVIVLVSLVCRSLLFYGVHAVLSDSAARRVHFGIKRKTKI